jgi:hypothetical protein
MKEFLEGFSFVTLRARLPHVLRGVVVGIYKEYS